ncbi:MAG TPA: RNA 2',3'-cyclic phosphodiesterase [Candidatus Cloacimonetes bacterium]|nr:RNA 2',3'-cyclic phosphodiesterase [Candidatus Cloacimonadota bacterium]
MKRTFLALELPSQLKIQFSNIIRELQSSFPKSVKWVDAENLHITLQFIGDTQENDISDLSEYFKEIFAEVPVLKFSNPEIQIIPGRNPRLIWIEMTTENKDIFKAAKKIKNKLHQMDYIPDKKSLRFHATLGRIKKRLPDFFISQILSKKISVLDFEVSEAAFYESILRPEGPVYYEIEKYGLGKNV